MRSKTIPGLLAAVVAFTLLPHAAGAAAERYIVVLKGRVADSAAVAGEHSRRYGAEVTFTYGHALNGYAATIPAGRLDDIRSDSRVAYVEPDSIVTAVGQTLPWGIDRVDADVSSAKAGDGSGAVTGVNIYVIDTGIDTDPKRDLNVVEHVNFAGGKNADCNGHGTHVAGTLAARDNSQDVVGVAPGAPLHGVKVLGCGGSGTTSGVIAGVDWVTANAIRPAVANMSLGGGLSDALDQAVIRSAASGVVYSLAAGNSGADACKSSPAHAGAGTSNGIITTAATDSKDLEASFSNFGSCVDIWAPGVSILSTKLRGGTTTMSGTSMASPHAGGTAALYLSTHAAATPSEVEAQLKADAATPGTKSKDGRAIAVVYAGKY